MVGGAAGSFLVGNPVAFPSATPVLPSNMAFNGYRIAMEEASLRSGNGAFTEFPSSQSLRPFERRDLCVRVRLFSSSGSFFRVTMPLQQLPALGPPGFCC